MSCIRAIAVIVLVGAVCGAPVQVGQASADPAASCTTIPIAKGVTPDISADGNTVVFTSGDDPTASNPGRNRVWAADLSTATLERLNGLPFGTLMHRSSVNGDGTRVVV